MTLSLRGRLTLWYTAALMIALILIATEVLWVVGRLGVRRTDDDLATIAATVVNVIAAELLEGPNVHDAAAQALDVASGPRRAIAILDAHGSVLAATPSATALAEAARASETGAASTLAGEWRLLVIGRTFQAGGRPAQLKIAVAQSLDDVQRERMEVRRAMIIGMPFALLLAAAGGWWIASIGLTPIRDMARQASALSVAGTGDLGKSDRADEIGVLARAFNGLLARLRAALRTQQQFMADASHELRTPTSVIRAAADVALDRPVRDESDYRETLAIVRTEAQRLGRLVADMLVLARADAGGQPLHPIDLYLNDVVAEGCRAVAVLAAERQVSLCGDELPETPFRGDEDLLRQLIVNLLQNAVQHTPPGGCIRLSMAVNANTAIIRMTDQGPGIPLADRERIFDRFVRLDASRGGPGTGLGLPIARWVAEAHQGSLVLESSDASGSTFCVTLPIAITEN
jgi:heavy metal sensor kinase